jgi:hypothetical protein
LIKDLSDSLRKRAMAISTHKAAPTSLGFRDSSKAHQGEDLEGGTFFPEHSYAELTLTGTDQRERTCGVVR